MILSQNCCSEQHPFTAAVYKLKISVSSL